MHGEVEFDRTADRLVGVAGNRKVRKRGCNAGDGARTRGGAAPIRFRVAPTCRVVGLGFGV